MHVGVQRTNVNFSRNYVLDHTTWRNEWTNPLCE